MVQATGQHGASMGASASIEPLKKPLEPQSDKLFGELYVLYYFILIYRIFYYFILDYSILS